MQLNARRLAKTKSNAKRPAKEGAGLVVWIRSTTRAEKPGAGSHSWLRRAPNKRDTPAMPSIPARQLAHSFKWVSMRRRTAGSSRPERYSSRLSITTACILFFPYQPAILRPDPAPPRVFLPGRGQPASEALTPTKNTAPPVSACRQAGRTVQPLCRLHQLLAGAEKLHLDGVFVHPGSLRQLFHGVTFHFFQHQQHALLLGHPSEELHNVVPLRQAGVGRCLPVHSGLGILPPPHFVLAEIAFVNQLAHLALAQVIEALVDRDFIDPGDQRTAEIEIPDGNVNFGALLALSR